MYFMAVSMIFCMLKLFWVFGYLQTSLLCIVGELAGGASVVVTVGVSVFFIGQCEAICF